MRICEVHIWLLTAQKVPKHYSICTLSCAHECIIRVMEDANIQQQNEKKKDAGVHFIRKSELTFSS